MAALEILALNEATPQIRAPGTGDTYTAPRAIALAPETLTGSAATSSLAITQTWNTSGTPTALSVEVTNTASNAASSLVKATVGATTFLDIKPSGTSILPEACLFGGSLKTAQINYLGLAMKAGAVVGWTSGNADGTIDITLTRDAANTLALRNGTNAQTFSVYNTYTDASNYERGYVGFTSNEFRIGVSAAGTGTQRSLGLYAGATQAALVGNGSFRIAMNGSNTDTAWFDGAMYPQSDNVTDMGVSASRWKNIFIKGYISFTPVAVASLPSAATAGAGARHHVTDALAPTFGATVTNGGAVSTPVYSDGTNWKVG